MDLLFEIQITLPNKKRRDKTAIEFKESLMVYLGMHDGGGGGGFRRVCGI